MADYTPAPGCNGTVYKILKPGSGAKSQSAGSFLEKRRQNAKQETVFWKDHAQKRDVFCRITKGCSATVHATGVRFRVVM